MADGYFTGDLQTQAAGNFLMTAPR